MGKPAKIRKKKSFMFTTRHYSFMSIFGIMLGLFCIAVIATSIVHSYNNAGAIDGGFGGVGMFSALLNIIGILCGVVSLGERDIYVSAAVAAIVINSVVLFGWLVMIILSMIA